jgi:hypothetical protein
MTDQPGRVAKLTTLMNAMLISKLGTLSDRFLGGSQLNSQDTFDLSQWSKEVSGRNHAYPAPWAGYA